MGYPTEKEFSIQTSSISEFNKQAKTFLLNNISILVQTVQIIAFCHGISFDENNL